MNPSDLELLKASINRVVEFHCKDGEIVNGTVHFVSEEESDVVDDLISSNRMIRYEAFGNSAYRMPFDEIDFVTLPES